MNYFSYGSNMSILRLQARAPSARVMTIGTLHGHDLRFHKKSKDGSGKCDAYATGNDEHFVIGVIYEIEVAEKTELDRIEGLGYGYEGKEVEIVDQSGKQIMASTYLATDIDCNLGPYDWYKHHVIIGAQERGLPARYVEKIDRIESFSDPDSERLKREMRIYNLPLLSR